MTDECKRCGRYASPMIILDQWNKFVDAVDEWQTAMCSEPLDETRTDIPDIVDKILDARKTIETAGYHDGDGGDDDER